MSSIKGVVSSGGVDFSRIEEDLKRLAMEQHDASGTNKNFEKTEFMDLLERGLKEVNMANRDAEKMSQDLATGKTSNIHETMLSVTKAELSFNMMVQMRNKVIEAYQEVLRMQV